MNVEYYRKESEKLFEQWQNIKDNAPFIKDGIMNPDVWFLQRVRPLFLFNEAFGIENGVDVNSYSLTEDTVRRVWQRISLWAKGIMNTGIIHTEIFDPWNKDVVNLDNRYIDSIAAVNIKKRTVKGRSDYNEICEYAKSEKDLLKKQIELCNPTVIICCGTAKALEIILDQQFRQKHNNNLFYTVKINRRFITVIDYWKPSNSYPEVMNYYCLTEIYRRAIKSSLSINR